MIQVVADPHLVHRADTYELWLAELNDSEGNTHAMMSEVRPNAGSLPGD